jgi:predicted kinase
MKLILLNGPAGVGKTTIAERLHADISDSVYIDVDALRRTIPNHREHPKESLRQAYEKTKDVLRSALLQGKTVIIDKVITAHEVLNGFSEEGNVCGAEVYEIILFAKKETVQGRADMRGYRCGGLLTSARVGELWDMLNVFREERVGAKIIDTDSLVPEEVYEKIGKIIGI